MVERFPVERKKWRLNQDIMTKLSEEISKYVPELIMSDREKSSTFTVKSMFNGKTMPTDTVRRQVGWSPSISEAESVMKITLM